MGTGQFDEKYEYGRVPHWGAFQWAKPVVKIVLDGISDMVDHTVSVSFGLNQKQDVRIQVQYPHIFLLCPADKCMDTIDIFSWILQILWT